MLSFAVHNPGRLKCKFQYKITLVGEVCRACWVTTAGYVNPRNGRVAKVESSIRKGHKTPKRASLQNRWTATDRSAYARSFIRDYIFTNSQYSPSATIVYVEFTFAHLYSVYKSLGVGRRVLSKTGFHNQWQRVLCAGVTDPQTAKTFTVAIRCKTAKGFDKCNTCEYYASKIAGASNASKKATWQRRRAMHVQEVLDDREELARIKRLCMTDPKHTGFYFDAADSCKYGVPTTAHTGKSMCKLWCIRQKLTCIQLFELAKRVAIFRTLPDVPTGGNLTATIFTRLLLLPEFKDVEHIHVNVDGSGDNINYSLIYAIVHILLCADIKGWALKKITLYRFKVGHTHSELDVTFTLLSRFVYGKCSRGDARKDIFSLSHFKQVSEYCLLACTPTHPHSHSHSHTNQICREVYGDRLLLFEDIRKVYDFDTFV